MKKLAAFTLLLAILFTLSSPALATPPEIAPYYVNVNNVMVSMNISDTGKATLAFVCNANSNMKSATVYTYLEKKVKNEWVRFAIPQRFNRWEYTTTALSFAQTYEARVTAGDYRAVFEFHVTGEKNDTITKMYYGSYNP